MSWTLAGTRIFVQEDNLDGGQIIPRLQPIAGGTVLQIFGYESPTRNLSALVVGTADRDTLMALTQDGNVHALISPEGVTYNCYVQKFSSKRLMSICQTLRSDLASDSPVYSVTALLYGS
jgi:hypothetical protein